jgi:hypothetical protein
LKVEIVTPFTSLAVIVTLNGAPRICVPPIALSVK